MGKKSKKVKRRVGRALASALGWSVVAVGVLTLAFVACAALGVSFPSAVEDFVIVSKVKSSVVLSFVAAIAFTLLGVVILLSVRLIVNDEKVGIMEERAALDARDQAIREVNASMVGILGEEEDERDFAVDFMPPSCLLDETSAYAESEEKTEEPDENSPEPDETESDKTVVPLKPTHKTRKHKRRPQRR